jgi:hypothetical protein
MRHIYSRACTVVVWLGKKYVEYQGNIGHTQSNEFFRPREREVDSPSSSNSKPKTAEHKKEQAMAKELSTDGYWDRLWIIQEITQAEGPRGFRIQVCFGRLAMRWDMFIRFITMHGCGERGPLRLDRQLKEKYAGGHSLKRLLQEHRGAKCKEPKDKIYGLVGLAADARGFPMDYSKTPFEVWIDTMEFMNKRNLLEEKEIVEFGCLVRSLLIEPNCTPLWQSLESFEPKASSTRLIEDMQSARVFHMRGYILGYVCYVGPSISSIVGDLNKIDEWEEYIQLNFKDELAGAYHDSNYLLEAIIGSSETQLTSTCSSNISTVRWRGDLGQPWYHSAYSFSINLMKEFNPGIEAAQKISSNPARGHIPGAPVLFQIYEPCGVSTPWKVGISTRLVQTGDLIYCVPGVKQVLIIRVHTIDESFAKLQIFGTGMVFDDVVGYKWDVERKDRRLTHETTEIKMDARTLFALLP